MGENYRNNLGENFTIIRYNTCEDIDVEFDDGTIITNRSFSSLSTGKIKNPNAPSVYNVGYIGQGEYRASINNTITKSYSIWKGILERCHSEKYQQRQPSYIGCSVTEEWHNFQNFAKWMSNNYNPILMDGWQLDKDILVKGNKVYSPETCCFVPQEVNLLLCKANKIRGNCPIGTAITSFAYLSTITKNGKRIHIGSYRTLNEAFQAYKTAKEAYIKEVADRWKDKITKEVYQALLNYQVEITD